MYSFLPTDIFSIYRKSVHYTFEGLIKAFNRCYAMFLISKYFHMAIMGIFQSHLYSIRSRVQLNLMYKSKTLKSKLPLNLSFLETNGMTI